MYKMLKDLKLKISDVILSNIFLCKNFHYGFINELLTKNISQSQSA